MVKNFLSYILAGCLFILGLSIGFFAGKQLVPQPVSNQSGSKPDTNNQAQLFSSESATLRGQIIKVAGNNLTVKNLATNATGEIKAAARMKVIKNGKEAPSSELSSLELNKEVLINLNKQGDNYEAVVIQYPLAPSQPTASLNPAPSLQPSAKP